MVKELFRPQISKAFFLKLPSQNVPHKSGRVSMKEMMAHHIDDTIALKEEN